MQQTIEDVATDRQPTVEDSSSIQRPKGRNQPSKQTMDDDVMANSNKCTFLCAIPFVYPVAVVPVMNAGKIKETKLPLRLLLLAWRTQSASVMRLPATREDGLQWVI